MVIVPREVAEVPPSVNQLAKMTSSPQITFPARKGDGITEKGEDGGLVTAPRFYWLKIFYFSFFKQSWIRGNWLDWEAVFPIPWCPAVVLEASVADGEAALKRDGEGETEM